MSLHQAGLARSKEYNELQNRDRQAKEKFQ